MKRAFAGATVAVAVAVGPGTALASTPAKQPPPPQTWLVYLGHRTSASKFGTIKVYVTGYSYAGDADRHAVVLLRKMGAPAPDQTIGTERVIVRASPTHKWLVKLGHLGSTITVGVIGYPSATSADARAIKELEHVGAPAPDQIISTQSVRAEVWQLHHRP
jgi:hypothetical protein